MPKNLSVRFNLTISGDNVWEFMDQCGKRFDVKKVHDFRGVYEISDGQDEKLSGFWVDFTIADCDEVAFREFYIKFCESRGISYGESQ